MCRSVAGRNWDFAAAQGQSLVLECPRFLDSWQVLTMPAEFYCMTRGIIVFL